VIVAAVVAILAVDVNIRPASEWSSLSLRRKALIYLHGFLLSLLLVWIEGCELGLYLSELRLKTVCVVRWVNETETRVTRSVANTSKGTM
jgi:hypothetical protein